MNLPFGFNVIGHISGNLGLGVAARSVVRLVKARGFPVCIHNIDPGGGRDAHDASFDDLAIADFRSLPYAVNLFVLPPPAIEVISRRHTGDVFYSRRINVALSFWELNVVPKSWVPALSAVDVVVGVTDSMRSAFATAVSGPFVIGGRLPLEVPPGVSPSRKRFAIPDEAVTFVTSFEPSSDPQRKNPLAALKSFLKIVGDEKSAYLIIKINNSVVDGKEDPVVEQLRQASGGHPRVHFFTETLSYVDTLSLYASCDVYVSLHRAEGLGLGLMEAMMLGKPVIATAWSGNMTFMNHSNSCLVPYRLVPVKGAIHHYTKALDGLEALWADPSVEESAAWMRVLASNESLRTRIGLHALNGMRDMNEAANRGEFLDEIRAIFENRSFLDEIIPRPEATRFVGQLLNRIDRLESEMDWLTNRPAFKVLKATSALRRLLKR